MPHKKQKAIRSNNNKCYLRPNDRFGLNLGSLTPRNARHKIVDKRSGVAVSAERAQREGVFRVFCFAKRE